MVLCQGVLVACGSERDDVMRPGIESQQQSSIQRASWWCDVIMTHKNFTRRSPEHGSVMREYFTARWVAVVIIMRLVFIQELSRPISTLFSYRHLSDMLLYYCFATAPTQTRRRWRHLPTACSVTAWPRAAHSLLMSHFRSSTYDLKTNKCTINVK